MSVFIYGAVDLRNRFLEVVRQELGQDLGRFLELVLEQQSGASQLRFSQYTRHMGGASPPQRRFFQFLNEIIRNSYRRVEIEIVANNSGIFWGAAFGPRQRIDIADLVALNGNNQAFTRMGIITHEIAERDWLVVHGYQHQPGIDLTIWLILWFDPAHEYALQKEEEVTGWHLLSQSPPRNLNEIPPWALRDPQLRQFFEVQRQLWTQLFPDCPPNSEWEWQYESRGRGRSYAGRRRVVADARCRQAARAIEEQVPVNPQAPQPLGR
jgi:hypothetical protein